MGVIMRFRYFWLFPILLFIIATGCSLKHQVKGEYYLNTGKYKQGISSLDADYKKDPNQPSTNYFLGRFYLAEKQYQKALHHLKRAVQLSPDKADYHFWLGLAHAANDQRDLERKCYQRVLAMDNIHLQALTYLGHNLLEESEYEEALKTYNTVLELKPDIPSALYSRALILKHLGRSAEEKIAWTQYLSVNASGAKARKAVSNLNVLGDFDYRNHLVGRRMVTLKKIRFLPFNDRIDKTSLSSLDVLGSILKNNDDIAVHIVAYQKNNIELGESRAKSIKKYLLNKYPQIKSSRLKVSWFGVAEEIEIGNKTFIEGESINFITVVNPKTIVKIYLRGRVKANYYPIAPLFQLDSYFL